MVIVPVTAVEINPENSDFNVGNFLTKKAAPCQEAALAIQRF